jgi:hypothetical protein
MTPSRSPADWIPAIREGLGLPDDAAPRSAEGSGRPYTVAELRGWLRQAASRDPLQTGQSGNPRGRPKGSKNKRPALNEERLKDIILDEAYRTISVRDGDRHVSVPMAQAVIRSLAVNAAKGNQRAQKIFTDLLTRTERENKRLHDELLDTALEYKVQWNKELDRRRRLGIKDAPPPLPHPDDLKIDLRTGIVQITGPMTMEEIPLWNGLRQLKRENKQDIADLERALEGKPDGPQRKTLLDDLEQERTIRDFINTILPDELPNLLHVGRKIG